MDLSLDVALFGDEEKPNTLAMNEAHGLQIVIGATGSGKSACAHLWAHNFSGAVCHMCPPGGYSDCYEKGGLPYVIKINGQSKKALEWSERVTNITELDEPDYHTVGLLDEAYLFAHARRSQQTENLTWNTIISQARKGGNFLYMMSQTLRKIDVLLREDAKMIWQCWNPFRNGRITYAMGHPGADAALPPWKSPQPIIRTFQTWRAFGLYDSWEKYDADATKAELSEAPHVIVRNRGGELMPVPVQTLTQYVLDDCLAANMERVSYIDVMETIIGMAEDIGDAHPRHVRNAIHDLGYKMKDGAYLLGDAA